MASGALATNKTHSPSQLPKHIQIPPTTPQADGRAQHRSLNTDTMASGVPQGSVMGPFLYALFTADIPQHASTVLSTFADDTAILSRHTHINEAIRNLQNHLLSIEEW